MNRKKFIKKLQRELRHIDADERERIVKYYDELILDAVETGKTEDQAVSGLGSPESIAADAVAETPSKYVKRKKSTPIAEKILLLPFSIVRLSLAFAYAVTAASLGIAFFAVELSFLLVLIVGPVYAVVAAIHTGSAAITLAYLCAELLLAGLAVIMLPLIKKSFQCMFVKPMSALAKSAKNML